MSNSDLKVLHFDLESSHAVSTGKCKISDLFEKLGLWVRKTEFFARSEVQFLCDVLNILVRDVVEV